ncbi:MAG: Flp family type IVb pilin [Dehalococcoidia bacterium]|jgi:pilus assembly protein Flp/PilA|uniref:Pilus assembly protein Flp/PilA n=3 Tax=Tepidiforma TaxID=2682228 RepID=A0A2A9HEB1_TEPT2|nr:MULTISPECIES: Flp family type IVb pilin [Tepidiforma]MCL6643849.1 Flp family type IVb pilin [Dehalococcoidia bacterium]MCX7618271.1 Flp family type IVb pilin [Tepidiforma sp.]PFG74347.1 pilus assembly protein Flp/PilA [Tepidiforma thermophila]QFG01960.1 Flp family type IVb pilin [Tepidiforma bonchosmolovskayae]WBL35584.1 Flp family type IVb pilin [Tepidiforma flava]
MSKLRNWAVSKVAAWQARDEEGQGLAEYGLILALIAIVCIGALTLLGGNIANALNNVAGSI